MGLVSFRKCHSTHTFTWLYALQSIHFIYYQCALYTPFLYFESQDYAIMLITYRRACTSAEAPLMLSVGDAYRALHTDDATIGLATHSLLFTPYRTSIRADIFS